MRRLIVPLIILYLVLLSTPAFAGIPHYVNFQGKLTDAADTPINNTDPGCKLTFRIYDAVSGGNLEWSETHQGVHVENGVFSILLGTVTPLQLPFDKEYWISIEVDTADGTGEMARQRISSVGYAYYASKTKEADHALVADNLTTFSIPFYISGLELEYVDSKHIKVLPGTADIAGTVLTAAVYSIDLNIDDLSNYVDGSANPNPWIYVYVYNNTGTIGYKFSTNAPNKIDHHGNELGIKRYYTQDGTSYYRCVGAVRVATDNTIDAFIQTGNIFFYSVGVNLTTDDTAGSWTDLDCSSAIPAISTYGYFTFNTFNWGAGQGRLDAYVAIRPNGTSLGGYARATAGGIFARATDGPYGDKTYGWPGRGWCMTDSSQVIEYIDDAGSVNTYVDVIAYKVNIR